MGLLEYLKNKLSSPQNIKASNEGTSIFAPSGAVSISNAQQISWVFSCVNIKANSLAIIPLELYKKSKNGKEKDLNNPLYEILKNEPNPNLTAFEWKKMISQDLDLRGNHYCQIIKNGLGQIISLYPLRADLMQVVFDTNKNKIYKYSGVLIPNSRVLHFMDIPDSEGLVGLSRISQNKTALEFAKNSSSHGNKLFKNGIATSGAFSHPTEMSNEAFLRLKEELEEKYTGLENSGKPLLLEGGLTYTPLSITNSDSQWLESRKFNREEIATIFGVPSSMLNDTANTAYNNLEQKYLEFQTNSVLPMCTLIEQKSKQKLISAKDKKLKSIKFKFNTLLRVDAKSRSEFYRTLSNIAVLNPNEIRAYEGLNPYVGGDNYFMQLNNATVDEIVKGDENDN